MQAFAKSNGRITSRFAFTLIELLVVIAVIATLIGILLPSLAKARDTARTIKCASNVRQFGLSATAYSTENKGWYPILPLNSAGWNAFRASPQFLTSQFIYGGVAGMFSLYQNPDGGDGPPTGDYGFVGQGNPTTATYAPPQPVPGRVLPPSNVPIMRSYVDGFGSLVCPSDKEDRYYGPQPYTDNPPPYATARAKQPTTPSSEREVISYNISYLYIAGLRTDEANIVKPAPIWGDETNGPDVSTSAWYGGGGNNQANATAAGTRPGFYAPTDNHGREGANFSFTDGHVEFLTGNIHLQFYGNSEDPGLTPEERRIANSGSSVNTVRAGRSRFTQTID